MQRWGVVIFIVVGGWCGLAGCVRPSGPPVRVDPLSDTQLMIHMGPRIGPVRLWVPEGIMSERGTASIYPRAEGWTWDGSSWRQKVGPEGLFGGGNAGLVDADTAQCVGIEMARESVVSWETQVRLQPDGVEFSIVLTNLGSKPIYKTGAAICAKLAEAPWWSDDRVFVRSEGRWRSLAELGRSAGRDEVFEAYLLAGESFDNVFYHQFWGVNPHRLDAPIMIAERPDREADSAGTGDCALAISGERAYFLHSNRENPCTDVMLAFGDLEPGETRSSRGRLWFGRSARLGGVPANR